jgi:hypothetical protein
VTLIRPLDIPAPHWDIILSSGEILLVVVVSILEIVLAVFLYLCWAFPKLRSRSATVKVEIKRFIASFIVIFVVFNALWMTFVLNGSPLSRVYSTLPVVLALFLEIVITLSIYSGVHSVNQPDSAETGIKRFIIIFVIVYAAINSFMILTFGGSWHYGYRS